MRKAEKLAAVTQILADCAGYQDGDEVAGAIKAALDYYFMRPRGDETPGRSSVISGDLSAMTEAVLSQMMGAYTSARAVEFEPDGAEDNEAAQIETDVCVADVSRARGYIKFQQAIKDALLHRVGVLKVWVRESTDVRAREFRQVKPEAYAELVQEKKGIRFERIDYKRGRLTYSEMRDRRELRLDPVDPGNFVHTKNWHTTELEDIPCVGERHVTTRSEMLKVWKFDREKVDELGAHIETRGTDAARNPRGMQRKTRSPDPSLDQIQWYELYILLDVDGDGIAERRRVCIVPNQEILADEPAPFVPYAVGSVLLNSHRMLGVSLFDKLKQIQDERTALKRQRLDNGNAVNKSRVVYLQGKVDQRALEDGRINSAIAVTGSVQDARQAVAALVVPDMSAGNVASMDQSARERSELGGAALELASGQAQLTDRVGSQGLDRAYSVMEQLAELMTHNIAQTLVADTFVLVHRTRREYFADAITVQRRGQPTTTRPSEWPERRQVLVKIGMSPGERRRRLDGLDFLIQSQLVLLKEGQQRIMVDKGTLYAALMDRARIADVPNPEQYILDPDSDASKAAEQALEQGRAQERVAQQRLMDMALGLEQLRISLEKRAADADRVLEYFKAILDAEKAEAAVVGDAATKFELANREDARAAREAKHEKDTLEGVNKAMSKLEHMREMQ
jgi:hypothetical protein